MMAHPTSYKVRKLALLWFWLRRRRKEKRQHRHWIHPIFTSRNTRSEFHHLFRDVSQDNEKFKEYLRMEQTTFDLLLSLCKCSLQKQNTNFREAISVITKRKTCCDAKVCYLYLFYDKAIVPQNYDRRLNDN